MGVDINYKISNDFRFQTLFGFGNSANDGSSYATERTEYMSRAVRFNEVGTKPTDPAYINSRVPVGGQFNKTTSTSVNWSWRNSISFNKTFATKHTIAVLFGEEMSSIRYEGFQTTAYGYLRDRGRSFAALPLTYTTAKTVNPLLSISPTIIDRRTNTMGLYLSSSYSFKSRYVASFSVRNDRSTDSGSLQMKNLILFGRVV